VTKRIIALLACLVGILAISTAPASAGWDFKSVPQSGLGHSISEIVATAPGVFTSVEALNPVEAWHIPSHYPCVNDHTGGGSSWPAATAASEWGRMSYDLNFAFDYELADGCTGWSEATTIDIYYYNGGTTPSTCATRDIVFDYQTGAVQNANIFINLQADSWCKGTSTRRANIVSEEIGETLGLKQHHNGSRSVMSDTEWSHFNLPYAQLIDGQTVDAHTP
jgi:hypothetical protein